MKDERLVGIPRRATTPIAMAIHMHGQSPIFGDQTTHVLIDDESGGPFVVLRQMNDSIKPGEVRLDPDELDAVVLAARKLLAAQPELVD